MLCIVGSTTIVLHAPHGEEVLSVQASAVFRVSRFQSFAPWRLLEPVIRSFLRTYAMNMLYVSACAFSYSYSGALGFGAPAAVLVVRYAAGSTPPALLPAFTRPSLLIRVRTCA